MQTQMSCLLQKMFFIFLFFLFINFFISRMLSFIQSVLFMGEFSEGGMMLSNVVEH